MPIPPSLRPTVALEVRDRRILFLMGVVGFVAGYGGAQMAHTLPFARVSLGLTEGEMSLVFALVRAASLLGVVFAMRADRSGRRRPLLVAFLLLVTGSLVTAFFPTTALYAVSQAAVRIAVVAVASLGLVVLAEELTPGARAYGIGIYGLAGSLGVGTGLVLLPIAEQSPDAWRILFGLTATGLLAFPMLSRYLPESRAFRPGIPVPFHQALSMGLGRFFWPLAGIAFLVAAFSAPAFDFVLERLVADLGWDTGAARFLLIVFSGLGTLGLLVGGRMADLRGRRVTTVTALVLGAAGGVAFYVFDSGWILAPAIFLASFGATMFTPSFGAQRTELFPTRVRATAGAWIANATILGSIVGFLAGGLAIDRFGLPATVAGLGVGVLGAVGLTLRLPETRGRDLLGRRAARAGATRRGRSPAAPSSPRSPTTPPPTPDPSG